MSSIVMEEELRIRNVSQVWEQIIGEETSPEIDCSSLEKVDGAGFQLLLYLQKKEYNLSGLSDSLRESLGSRGFEI